MHILIDWALYLHQIWWLSLSIITVARAVWVIINAIYNDRKSTPTSIPAKDCHRWLTCHVLSVHKINSFFKSFLDFFFFLFLIPPHHFTGAPFLFPSTHRFNGVLCIFCLRCSQWITVHNGPALAKRLLCMPTCLAGSCRGWSTAVKTFPKHQHRIF